MSLCPLSPACAPGLGLGLRLLHLQLEFTHLAEVWMRLLAPQFVWSCSPCNSKSNIQWTFHTQTFPLCNASFALPSHNLPFSRYSDLFGPFLFCFHISPLLSQLHLCSEVQTFFSVSGLPNICLLWLFLLPELSKVSVSSMQGNHTPHYELGADVQWSADIISLFWIQQQKLIFLCVSVDIRVLGAANIDSGIFNGFNNYLLRDKENPTFKWGESVIWEIPGRGVGTSPAASPEKCNMQLSHGTRT